MLTAKINIKKFTKKWRERVDKEYKIKIGKIIFQASEDCSWKAVGRFLIAMALNLEYATTAGIITLLSIVPTKWDTLKLSMYRVITFCCR